MSGEPHDTRDRPEPTPAEDGRRLVHVSPDAARAMIARAMLGATPRRVRLGGIELAPHQIDAVARLRRELSRTGGALLADATGLGKTYVALALASEAQRPLIVAPAALRAMWHDAMDRARVTARFVSAQRLSIGIPPLGEPDLIVVDEAHHFRNSATRRYATLAELSRRARVLLLTATPVHNTSRELDALLALFLGAAAATLGEAERARCIVRRESAATWGATVPRVEPTRWLALGHDEEMLDAIVALPPPLAPSDGDDAGALLTFSLLRQWASSESALAAALRRRLARAAALIAALEEGRHPSRAELTAWRFADDAVQLAFPGLVATETSQATEAMLEQARTHESAVRALLRRLGARERVDAERAERLRAVRAAHAGERMVVFSQFADTIDALWRELRADSGVCALAGRGARVAGGAIARAAALARFAPSAQGVAPSGDAERVDLLLTTDLLSEGVNLQDASVIVHLDLPWTPARIEQRIGRLARPGSARDRVAVYAFAPPARAEVVLAVERRLREKLRAAARASGVSGMIVPGLLGVSDAEPRSAAQHDERTRRVLARWMGDAEGSPGDGVAVAAVAAAQGGFLALLLGPDGPRLVASVGGEVTDEPEVIARAVELAEAGWPLRDSAELADAGHPQSDSAGTRYAERDDCADAKLERAVHGCIDRIETWLAARRGAEGVDLRLVAGERARRQVLRRVATILARSPRHDRPRISALAHAARRSAMLPLGSGAERVLRELAGAAMPDEAWLLAVSAFGHAHRGGRDAGAGEEATDARLDALIVLAP